MEEHDADRISKTNSTEVHVKLKNASFSWGYRVKDDQEEGKNAKQRARLLVEEVKAPILSDIDLDLVDNGLVVVVGQVGTGKTTLLYSILEETRQCSGSRDV